MVSKKGIFVFQYESAADVPSVVASVRPEDVEGMVTRDTDASSSQEFVIQAHRTRSLSLLRPGQRMPDLLLGPKEWEVYTVCEVLARGGEWAPVALDQMLNGGGALESCSLTPAHGVKEGAAEGKGGKGGGSGGRRGRDFAVRLWRPRVLLERRARRDRGRRREGAGKVASERREPGRPARTEGGDARRGGQVLIGRDDARVCLFTSTSYPSRCDAVLILFFAYVINIQPEVARYLACTARGPCVLRAVGEAGGAR